jgi:hypothetical protein
MPMNRQTPNWWPMVSVAPMIPLVPVAAPTSASELQLVQAGLEWSARTSAAQQIGLARDPFCPEKNTVAPEKV